MRRLMEMQTIPETEPEPDVPDFRRTDDSGVQSEHQKRKSSAADLCNNKSESASPASAAPTAAATGAPSNSGDLKLSARSPPPGVSPVDTEIKVTAVELIATEGRASTPTYV